jgi:hypothetical protein
LPRLLLSSLNLEVKIVMLSLYWISGFW